MPRDPLTTFITFVVITCALATDGYAVSPEDNRVPQALSQDGEDTTHSLARLISRYDHSADSERPGLETELLATLEERRAILRDLLLSDPSAARRLTLPIQIRSQLPTNLRDLAERPTVLEGRVESFYIDSEIPDGNRVLVALETDFGERFSLHFDGPPPLLGFGREIAVAGWLFRGLETEPGYDAGALLVDNDQEAIIALEADGDEPVAVNEPVAAAATATSVGEQSTIVLMVNFMDDAREPRTHQEVHDMVFGTVNDYYIENSHGVTWFSGDVSEWLTLPINATCSSSAIATHADDAATNAGIDLGLYNRKIYFFPSNGCGTLGIGTIGGSPSQAWIYEEFTLRVFGHELGHNFGLHHAHHRDCGLEVMSGTCGDVGRGHVFDIMGLHEMEGHLNGFFKGLLGWYDQGVAGQETISLDGTYDIEPFESVSNGNKVIKIPRGPDPDTGVERWFILTYRQGLGFDSFLTGNTNVENGVLIQIAEGQNSDSAYLLDLTPGSGTATVWDWDDPALTVNQSFHDPDSGVTITPVYADASGAAVNVAFGPLGCDRVAPTLSVSPAESPWQEPGATYNYTVSLTSQDSLGCGAATFDLESVVPAGWSGTFDDPQPLVGPGETRDLTYGLTSAVDASDGYYDANLTAIHGADVALTTASTATYVVQASTTNTAPVALNDSADTRSGETVVVPVLANDVDIDGDPLFLVTVEPAAIGEVTQMPDGSISYQADKKSKGTDSFQYTVTDGIDFAVGTVTINVSRKGRGKGKSN